MWRWNDNESNNNETLFEFVMCQANVLFIFETISAMQSYCNKWTPKNPVALTEETEGISIFIFLL